MRWPLLIAVLLMLIGLVWIGQGVGIIGGGAMSGQSIWAIIGALALAVGIVVLWRERAGSRAGTGRSS